MDRNEITRLAREAGFVGMDGDHGALRRFASLVAKQAYLDGVNSGISAERSRFADECIDLVAMYGGSVDLEAAIRARGNHANG